MDYTKQKMTEVHDIEPCDWDDINISNKDD